MKYHLAIRRNELIHTTIRMNLRIIVLSEKESDGGRVRIMIPFIENSRKCKRVYGNRSRSVVAWGWGGGIKRDRRKLLGVMDICPLS